ncbi:MAG: pantoate--beta-alanine ligase [Candidatus Mycalebacterium zealandia]|nr:MAG: pantoate--beta-alanine ligase [Candidatus Mycalebacterium zealandia]
MREFSSAAVRNGRKVGLVPTMGSIHEGHLSVVRETSAHADVCVASIFVNPLQFSAGEDYGGYKRDEEGDVEKLSTTGIDAVFLPSADEIYPPGFQTSVEASELQKFLCGASRPGHFKGVATVVMKLFNIVSPDVAGFGEKDFQQLAIIKRVVRDLHLDVHIIAVPTVREPSGLAMSSRNEYLSEQERETAVAIPRVLFKMKRLFESGMRESAEILKDGGRFLAGEGIVEVDYLEICDPETLIPVEKASEGSLAAIAARVGKARLIDSIRF